MAIPLRKGRANPTKPNSQARPSMSNCSKIAHGGTSLRVRFPLRALIAALALPLILFPNASANAAQLFPRNTEVPFSYVTGGERSWPILDAPLGPDDSLSFSASIDGKPLASGASLSFDGIKIALSDKGQMTLAADSQTAASFQLLLSLSQG